MKKKGDGASSSEIIVDGARAANRPQMKRRLRRTPIIEKSDGTSDQLHKGLEMRGSDVCSDKVMSVR